MARTAWNRRVWTESGAALEALEARQLLTMFTWTGAAGDNFWHTPGNWSPIGVPGAGAEAGADVFIDDAGGAPITITSQEFFDIGFLQDFSRVLALGRPSDPISEGGLAVRGDDVSPSFVRGVELNGAALYVERSLDIGGSSTWLRGAIVGVNPHSSVNFTGDVGLDGSLEKTLLIDARVQGRVDHHGGDLALGRYFAGFDTGQLTVESSGEYNAFQGRIIGNTPADVDTGDLVQVDGAFRKQGGGLFEVLRQFGGGGTVDVIDGELNLGSGLNAATYTPALAMLERGTWIVRDSGTLNIGEGTAFGQIAPGVRLSLLGPSSECLAAEFVLHNAGTFELGDGRAFPGFVPFASPPYFLNDGHFIKSGTGTTEVVAPVLFDNDGTVEVTGGTLRINASSDADLGGPSTSLFDGVWIVRTNSLLDLVGANITGLSGDAEVILDGVGSLFPATQNLRGTFSESSGLGLFNGRGFDFTPSTGTFINQGTFGVGGSGSVSIDLPFHNQGLALIGQPLFLLRGGEQTGEFRLVTYTLLQLGPNGTTYFDGDARVTGAGAVDNRALLNIGGRQQGSDVRFESGVTLNTGQNGSVLVNFGSTLTADGPFHNGGLVTIRGRLNALGGGISSGDFTLAFGQATPPVIDLGGEHDIGLSGSITGFGSVVVEAFADVAVGGPIDVTGSVSVGDRGGLRVDGPLTIGNGLHVFGGTLEANGLSSIAGASSLDSPFADSTVLTGAGRVTFSGTLDWLLGGMVGTGTTVISAGSTVTGDGPLLFLKRTIENHGQFDLADTIFVFQNATFQNLSSGHVHLMNAVIWTTGVDLFSNSAGSLLESDGAFCEIEVPFENLGTVGLFRGTVSVNSGLLYLDSLLNVDAATQSLRNGIWVVHAGATLNLPANGPVTRNETDFTLDGPNSAIVFNGVNDAFTANSASGRLRLNGRQYAATGFNNAGALEIEAGSTMEVAQAFSNSGTTSVSASTLNLGGGSVHTGALSLANAATLTLGVGRHEFRGASGISGSSANSGSIDCAGVFLHTGFGTSVVGAGITLDNDGTVRNESGTLRLDGPVVQLTGLNDGTFRLTGGAWEVSGFGGTFAPILDIPGRAISEITGGLATFVLVLGTGSAFLPLHALRSLDGRLTVTRGSVLSLDGPLQIQGADTTLAVAETSRLTVNGDVSLSDGDLRVHGASLFAGWLRQASGRTTLDAGSFSPVQVGVMNLSGAADFNGGIFDWVGHLTVGGDQAIGAGIHFGGTVTVYVVSERVVQTPSGAGNQDLTGLRIDGEARLLRPSNATGVPTVVYRAAAPMQWNGGRFGDALGLNLRVEAGRLVNVSGPTSGAGMVTLGGTVIIDAGGGLFMLFGGGDMLFDGGTVTSHGGVRVTNQAMRIVGPGGGLIQNLSPGTLFGLSSAGRVSVPLDNTGEFGAFDCQFTLDAPLLQIVDDPETGRTLTQGVLTASGVGTRLDILREVSPGVFETDFVQTINAGAGFTNALYLASIPAFGRLALNRGFVEFRQSGPFEITPIGGTLRNESVIIHNGVMTVHGNFVQTATGSLQNFQVFPVGGGVFFNAVLIVDGQASVDGLLSVAPGLLPDNRPFTIILAVGGITGTFSSMVVLPGSPEGRLNVLSQTATQILLTQALYEPADFNSDGVVDSQDYFDFLEGFFFTGDADVNGDGVTDSQDYFDFLEAFFS